MPLGTLAAAGLLLLAGHPAPAHAAEQSYHLVGHVSRIVAPKATTKALADLGVIKGAQVDIDWTVDLNASFVHFPQTNTNRYDGPFTHLKVEVDHLTDPNKHWIALGMTPTRVANQNIIYVGDADQGTLDYMDMTRSCTDTNLLVTGNDPNGSAEIGIKLAAPAGGASTSPVLGDQDPNAYTANTGFVAGLLATGFTGGFVPTGVEVDFAIPGIAGPDLTAKCHASRMLSAGALCQSTFKCLNKHAKAPANDPLGAVLETCRETAREKFVAAFDKAGVTAEKKGLSCRVTPDGPTLVAHFDAAINGVVGVVDSIDPQDPSTIASGYTAAGTMCAASAKAEANNVKKPSSDKLSAALNTARAKLTLAANKAIAKAEKKGVVFHPAPDVTALLDSIDAVINDIVTELAGS
jgi:hypothetical protein